MLGLDGSMEAKDAIHAGVPIEVNGMGATTCILRCIAAMVLMSLCCAWTTDEPTIKPIEQKVVPWTYKGPAYYKAIRDPLADLCTRIADRFDTDFVTQEELENAYRSLPDNPVDRCFVTYGKWAAHACRGLEPSDPEFAEEPDIRSLKLSNCIVIELVPEMPVSLIYAKTMASLNVLDVPQDMKGLTQKNVMWIYGNQYRLKDIFDERLSPVPPGTRPRGDIQRKKVNGLSSPQMRARRQEFYALINHEDPTTILKYLLFVMTYADNVYIGFDFGWGYFPYRGAKLDAWQRTWNRALPVLCEGSQLQDDIDGCPPFKG